MLVFAATFLFFGLCNGIILECEYNTTDWNHLGNVYYCYAKVGQLNTGHAVTGVSGNHASGKTNDDVKAIYIVNQPLDFIPRDVNKYFKNIQGLLMRETKVKFISKFDLQQFPELRSFYINGNPIEAVDGDLFSFTKKLSYVDLGSNKITSVGANLFSDLKDLRALYFYGNSCLSGYAHDNPTAALELSKRIVQACPLLTAEMVERTVNNLQSKIEPAAAKTNENAAKTNVNIAKTNKNVQDLQIQMRRLQVRLAELETIIFEMDARK
jgi:Leucine-rich repeat (LRR) protein